MKISYDYTELLEELMSDIIEFNKDEMDFIYIERDWDRELYQPIIDYSFEPLEVRHEKLKVILVLEEMENMNRII